MTVREQKLVEGSILAEGLMPIIRKRAADEEELMCLCAGVFGRIAGHLVRDVGLDNVLQLIENVKEAVKIADETPDGTTRPH